MLIKRWIYWTKKFIQEFKMGDTRETSIIQKKNKVLNIEKILKGFISLKKIKQLKKKI